MFSIKVCFNEEVRRVQIVKDGAVGISFSELSQTVRNIFPDLKNRSFSLLWRDDENDLVTVSSDQELAESVRVMESSGHSKVLRFIVRIDEGKEIPASIVIQEVPKLPSLSIVHTGVRCDECDVVPIKGIRYKCAVREDFDLCESCEAKKIQPYPMIKISDPQHAPAAIVYAFKDQNGKEVSNITPPNNCTVPAQESGFWRPQHLAQRLGFGNSPGHCQGGRGGGGGGWGHRQGPPGPPFNPSCPPSGPPGHHHPPPPHGHHHLHEHHHPHGHPYGHPGGRGFGGRGPPGAGRGGLFWNDPQAAVPVSTNPKMDRKIEKYERKIEKIESRMAKVKSLEPVRPVLPVATASFVAGMDAQTFSTPGSAASYASVSMPVSEVQRVMDEEQELQQAIRASYEDHASYVQNGFEDVQSDDEEVEDIDMDAAASAPVAPAEDVLQQSNAYSTLTNSLSSVGSSIAFGMGSGPASVTSASGVSASALPPKYEMRFVRDVTFPNGTLVQPGAVFQKIWRVRNDGLYAWPEGVTLGFCGGDELCDVTVQEIVPELEVGSEADISMTLQAPESTGRFVTYFRMETRDESKFGQRLYANIQVSDEEADWHLVKVALPEEQQVNDGSVHAEGVQVVESNTELVVKTVEEKDEHCDTFYACHSPNKQPSGDVNALPEDTSSFLLDEVNDSLEASMTLPSSRSASREAMAMSAEEEASQLLDDTDFAEEMALIDSATEALNIETAAAASASESASAPLDTYQSTVAVLWNRELQLLGDMGFSDLDVLIPLLQTHVGTPSSLSGEPDAAPQVEGMQRVVATLLSSFGITA